MILAINTMYSILLTFVTYAIGFFYHIRDENRAFSHNFYSETERKTSLQLVVCLRIINEMKTDEIQFVQIYVKNWACGASLQSETVRRALRERCGYQKNIDKSSIF